MRSSTTKAVFVFSILALGTSALASRAPAKSKAHHVEAKKTEPKADASIEYFLEQGAVCPIEGDACVAPTESRVFGYSRPGHYLPIGKTGTPKCQRRCLACARLPSIIRRHCRGGKCDRIAVRAKSRCERRYCKWMPEHKHDGADIGFGKAGTVVRNVITGTVSMVRHDPNTSTGRLVVVEVPWKDQVRTFWYMHLQRIAKDLQVGKRIVTGETIGTIGASGTWGSAPHLHLSVRGKLDSKEYHDPTALVVRGVKNVMTFTPEETEMAPQLPEVAPDEVPEAEVVAEAEKIEQEEERKHPEDTTDEQSGAVSPVDDELPAPEPEPSTALATSDVEDDPDVEYVPPSRSCPLKGKPATTLALAVPAVPPKPAVITPPHPPIAQLVVGARKPPASPPKKIVTAKRAPPSKAKFTGRHQPAKRHVALAKRTKRMTFTLAQVAAYSKKLRRR